jgi:hypothetical protein
MDGRGRRDRNPSKQRQKRKGIREGRKEDEEKISTSISC